MKNLFQSIAVISLIALIFSGANVFQVSAAPDSDLYINPATYSTSINTDFTLDVMLDPGANLVNGTELHFTYNHAILRLDNIVFSSSFPVSLGVASINNSNGTASISGATNWGETVNGAPATIATLSFHSLGVAAVDSPVEITSASLVTADNEVDNVLVNRTGALIAVIVVTYDSADFATLATEWLQAGDLDSDVNGDSVVNTRDLGIMMSNWQ